MKEDKKKLVLTGGHGATAALAIVEEIVSRDPSWDVYWIGDTTVAEKTLGEYGVKVRKIIAGRVKKKGDLLSKALAYLKIPVGFFHAFYVVSKISPDLILSFGGFAALPVVFSSWILGKPIIIHEQISGAGLANKLSAPFARKIAVARADSLGFFPESKTILTGNPQVSSILKIHAKDKIGNPPAIFITGGSSGSQIINEAIDNILEKLLEEFFVIHQTGERNFEHFYNRKKELHPKLAQRYEVFGYVSPNEVARFFERADIVVSRAGANTIADIVATRRPAILVPIPWSIGDEQRKNALKAVKTGLAVILEQKNLTGKSLFAEIKKTKDKWQEVVKNANTQEYYLDKNASKKIVNLLEDFFK